MYHCVCDAWPVRHQTYYTTRLPFQFTQLPIRKYCLATKASVPSERLAQVASESAAAGSRTRDLLILSFLFMFFYRPLYLLLTLLSIPLLILYTLNFTIGDQLDGRISFW